MGKVSVGKSIGIISLPNISVDYRLTLDMVMRSSALPIAQHHRRDVTLSGFSSFAHKLGRKFASLGPVEFETGLWVSGGGIPFNNLQRKLVELEKIKSRHWYLAGLEHLVQAPVIDNTNVDDRICAPGSTAFVRGIDLYTYPLVSNKLFLREGPGRFVGTDHDDPDDVDTSRSTILVVRPVNPEFRVQILSE